MTRFLRQSAAALAIIGILVGGLAHAGSRESLNAFTKGLKGLDGQFAQEVFDTKGQRKESSSGRVALAAPSLFRWEYIKPHPQLIVADGKTVWVHDPDLSQVTRRPQGQEAQNSPIAALVDPQRLERDFILKESGDREGLSWLDVRPKHEDDAGFRLARLGFQGITLARMEITDALGQRTDIRFSGWKRNPAFGADTFRFRVPKGVDVIGGP